VGGGGGGRGRGGITYNQGPRTAGWKNLHRCNNYRARSEPLNGYRISFSPAITVPLL